MKPPQIKVILAVVLLAVAVGVYLRFGRRPAPLADRVEFVCIATGKVYALRRNDIPAILPAVNPDTGTATLLPLSELDGRLTVHPHYARPLLSDPELAKVNRYVDPQTFEVLKTPRP